MHVDVEISHDQIQLRQKIRSLPELIKHHIGKLPPGFVLMDELDQINKICGDLEFKWKKWIFETVVSSSDLWKLLEETILSKENEYNSKIKVYSEKDGILKD